MDIDIRRVHASDARSILHVDQNSCEFPWETDDWYMLEDHYIPWLDAVVLVDGVIKGYSIFDFDKDTDSCRLLRYCIENNVDEVTREKIDDKMLDRIEYHCYSRDISTIEIDVCETELLGSADPYDRSVWLTKHGFKMTRKVKGLEYRYYRSYDVFYFAKPVEDSKFI